MRQFVGPGRATWYEANGDRAEQLLGILYGPSAEPDVVRPGLLRFGACYPHVCNIRAVLFVTTAGQIVGAGMLFPDCLEDCTGSEGMRLTILRDPAHPDIAALVRSWGEADIAGINSRYSFANETLGRVEIVDVPGQAARRR